jgi:flagellar motor component MotA
MVKVSFVIAIIIFVTAILSEASVKAYYSSTNVLIQIGTSIFAIFAMAFVILFILWVMPDLRKAILRIFGLDEEEQKDKPKS